LHLAGRVVLDCAAGLIALGGIYDIFTTRLPACADDARTRTVVRELLRALGGCLMSIGIAVAVLVNCPSFRDQSWTRGLVLLLVLPSEGINAIGMYRAGSPFLIPLAFIVITLLGVLLA